MPRPLLSALVTSSVLCPAPALAQSIPAMTLPEALSYARAHQPQIKSALAQFAARQAEAQVARARWLPEFGATVYDFGRISAQIAMTDAIAEQAHASADATQLDVQLGVQEPFASVLHGADLRELRGGLPRGGGEAIVAATAQLRAATADVKTTTRELLPDLFASAGLSGRAGGAPDGDQQLATGGGWVPVIPNWDVGLVLHCNLFDGTIWARRKAAQARQEAARADLESARMTVGLATERAWLDLDAALKVLPGLRTSVDAARANLGRVVGRAVYR